MLGPHSHGWELGNLVGRAERLDLDFCAQTLALRLTHEEAKAMGISISIVGVGRHIPLRKILGGQDHQSCL